jgi:membrane associated rhomboid family serine protease
MTEFRPSRFEILPAVIKNLLIINGIFFLAQITFPESPTANFSLEDMFALHAWQSELFKPWQLVTHLFMHGDFYHILGNMFALYYFLFCLWPRCSTYSFVIFKLRVNASNTRVSD